MDFSEILDELGQPVVYTAPDGAVSNMIAIVRDRGAKARIGRGIVLTSDAVATVSEDDTCVRNGTITTAEGTVYRLDAKQLGAPGLIEWTLTRDTGRKVETSAFAEDVLDEFGVECTWNGRVFSGHVVRTSTEVEVRRDGIAVEVVRTQISVRVSDVEGLRPGDAVEVRGVSRRVRSMERDGYGLVTLSVGD